MPFDAAKYLDECASACPYCGDDRKLRRYVSSALMRQPREERPSIAIPRYCAACFSAWTEVYRLEAVEPIPDEN